MYSDDETTRLTLTEGSRPDTVIRVEAEVDMPSSFTRMNDMKCYRQPLSRIPKFGCDNKGGPP